MVRPECVVDSCKRLAAKSRVMKDGTQSYKKKCNRCGRANYEEKYQRDRLASLSKDPDRYKKLKDRHRPYTLHKKSICESCGFIPEHPCQLDVDHIDGNNSNNEPSNLKTLCANCHRLKTFKAAEFRSKASRTYEAASG